MADNTGRLVRTKLWFDDGFTQIPNTWVRDKRLTYTARGVLLWMLSHEPGFEVTLISLASGTSHGVDAMRSAVSQLEKCGYVKRYQRRERGRIVGTDWEIRDPFTPVDNPGLFERDLKALNPLKSKKPQVKPSVDLPPMAEPPMAEPPMANPTTIEEQSIEDINTQVKNVTIERPVENVEPDGAPIRREVAPPPVAECGHLGYEADPNSDELTCVLRCDLPREHEPQLPGLKKRLELVRARRA